MIPLSWSDWEVFLPFEKERAIVSFLRASLIFNCSLAFLSHLTSISVALSIFYCLPSPAHSLAYTPDLVDFFSHAMEAFVEHTCDRLEYFSGT